MLRSVQRIKSLLLLNTFTRYIIHRLKCRKLFCDSHLATVCFGHPFQCLHNASSLSIGCGQTKFHNYVLFFLVKKSSDCRISLTLLTINKHQTAEETPHSLDHKQIVCVSFVAVSSLFTHPSSRDLRCTFSSIWYSMAWLIGSSDGAFCAQWWHFD